MDYNRIILELLDRIQVLETRMNSVEQKLSETQSNSNVQRAQSTVNLKNVSNKYKPLAIFLLNSGMNSVTLTYPEIEEILHFELPSSAYSFMHSFWANTTTHSYSSSWLNVGYKTRVNISEKTVTFEKYII